MIVASTVLTIAGIDLVLPAVPGLPDAIDGTLQQAQLVLAAFSGGIAVGLLAFGELGARQNQWTLLFLSLGAYAAVSLLATLAASIVQLIVIRFVQGFFAAAPAVFAGVMIRAMYDGKKAIRMLGLLGSIESVVPALAPVLGAWLLIYFDWRASFSLTAALALVLSVAWLFKIRRSEQVRSKRSASNYRSLLVNRRFMAYALSHAFTLGGLLIFVFGAPTVMTVAMGGELSDFVIMQVTGIAFFVIAANNTERIVGRFGVEGAIFGGSAISATGSVLVLAYALGGGRLHEVIWVLFVFVNFGLGVRGPPGFFRAIESAGENDARGSALVVLFILLTAAVGTAVVAPFIEVGLVPLSLASAIVCTSSVAILAGLKPRAGAAS